MTNAEKKQKSYNNQTVYQKLKIPLNLQVAENIRLNLLQTYGFDPQKIKFYKFVIISNYFNHFIIFNFTTSFHKNNTERDKEKRQSKITVTLLGNILHRKSVAPIINSGEI